MLHCMWLKTSSSFTGGPEGVVAVAAFDYHVPDKSALEPPAAASPEEVPTWNEFTQHTTIHGVRYIFNPRSTSLVRRYSGPR